MLTATNRSNIKISKEIEIKYEENALQIIAEKADGALRDALSIFDQMCSFCELNLTEESVSKNLNLLSRSIYIEITDKIISKNIKRSAIYSGNIEGVGPRYCPSIEDKVVKFSEKASHQIFLEPEGLNDITIYPNGISTSCLLYTSPSPRDATLSRMPSSA